MVRSEPLALSLRLPANDHRAANVRGQDREGLDLDVLCVWTLGELRGNWSEHLIWALDPLERPHFNMVNSWSALHSFQTFFKRHNP
jgi:hypothetical protein